MEIVCLCVHHVCKFTNEHRLQFCASISVFIGVQLYWQRWWCLRHCGVVRVITEKVRLIGMLCLSIVCVFSYLWVCSKEGPSGVLYLSLSVVNTKLWLWETVLKMLLYFHYQIIWERSCVFMIPDWLHIVDIRTPNDFALTQILETVGQLPKSFWYLNVIVSAHENIECHSTNPVAGD